MRRIRGLYRSRLGQAALALVTAIAALSVGSSCQRSSDWNTVFHRSRGWKYADGGSSAELPNGKTVWLFGDSFFEGAPLLPNTIAVQDTEAGVAPSPDRIHFFARDDRGRALDVSRRAARGMKPWLEPHSPQGHPSETWMWPTDAIATGGSLIAFYSEIGCVRGTFPSCRSYLGNFGFVGHTVLQVDNPTSEPAEWRVQPAPLVDRAGRTPAQQHLHWGSALVEEAGWLYVFGVELGENSEPGDVKLARVVPDRVGRYDRWQFLSPSGWRLFPTGPSPSDLQSVARGGATELSVDRVERNGASWFVMVQVDITAHEVVVRSTPGATVEAARFGGPDAGRGVRRLSIPALDPVSAGGLNWAGRAHRRHSPSADHLFVSYFSSQAESLRFLQIPLSSAGDGL